MTEAETTKSTPEVVGKQELVKRIAKQTDVTQKQVSEIFDATLIAIKEALQVGEEVRLVGFGSFAVKRTAAQTGINPRNGERIEIPAKESVRFYPGKELVEAVLKSDS